MNKKRLINPDFAIEIIKSGYSLKNVQVEGTLNFEYLAVDNDVNEQIIIEESIIDEILSLGLLFKKRVVFRNSIFKYITMFQAAYFYGGLEIHNCIFENLVDFSCGGHNKDGNEIRIEDNTFKKFVNFDDCIYDGPFIMKNNNFDEGTNLLGEWQLSPSFDEVKIIENNKGELTLIDLPKPYSEYYTREETSKIEPEIELEIKETIGTVEEGIDSFIKFIETLIPEDKTRIIDEQLNDLNAVYKNLNDKKLKKYIDILEVLKENNKSV